MINIFIIIIIVVQWLSVECCIDFDKPAYLKGNFTVTFNELNVVHHLSVPTIVDICTRDVFVLIDEKTPAYLTKENTLIKSSIKVDCVFRKEIYIANEDFIIERFYNIIHISAITATTASTTSTPSTTKTTSTQSVASAAQLTNKQYDFDNEFAFYKFFNDKNDIIQWAMNVLCYALLIIRERRRIFHLLSSKRCTPDRTDNTIQASEQAIALQIGYKSQEQQQQSTILAPSLHSALVPVSGIITNDLFCSCPKGRCTSCVCAVNFYKCNERCHKAENTNCINK